VDGPVRKLTAVPLITPDLPLAGVGVGVADVLSVTYVA
jgi:hypothetical protein